MIMSTAISGLIFSTFAGQPLSILGATGPFLAYTLVVYDLAAGSDLEFMPFYFWTCMWCALFTILVAVFDLCALMKHVTMLLGCCMLLSSAVLMESQGKQNTFSPLF